MWWRKSIIILIHLIICINSSVIHYEIEELSGLEFADSLTNVPTFALLCDYEKSCTTMKTNFIEATQLYYQNSQTKNDNVRFVYVLDKYGTLMETFQLDIIPRIVMFENKRAHLVKLFGTRKQGGEGVFTFIVRMLQPSVSIISNANQLNEFLNPSNTYIRDVIEEDPVTFFLIEPAMGSLLARTSYYTEADKYRGRKFFGHIRLTEETEDLENWKKLLNVTTLPSPSLIRVETNHPTKILLNEHSEFFEEDGLTKAINRYSFPEVIWLDTHNLRDVLTCSYYLTAIATVKTKENVIEMKQELATLGQEYPNQFLFAYINRTQFYDFLAPFLDDDHDFFVYNFTQGTFWVKDGNRQKTKSQFLSSLLKGKEYKQYENSFRAVPRLLRKAIIKSPKLGFILMLVILIPSVLIYSCYKTCFSVEEHLKQE